MSANDFVRQIQASGGKAQVCWDPWTAPDEEPVASLLDLVDHPITGPMRHLASPFTLDGFRPKPIKHAPLFDQDTDEVLATIAGLDEKTIAGLRRAGHIGGELPPPSELGFVYD
tara:strand:- start:964 stop:1305 length:342 start_codon:yes stop_codon:yes gene_type:complete